MFKNSAFDAKNQLIAFLLFFFIIGMTWQLVRQNNIVEKGMYTISWVIKTETIKGGFLTTLNYKFRNEEYTARVRSKYGSESVGEAYFIKILSDRPNEIVFLEGNKVPGCLLNIKIPEIGWRELPACP